MSVKILLLEDNHELAGSLVDYLEARGLNVEFAFNGKACLEFARADSYNVYVLDIAMPGIDGLEVCKQLRQMHRDDTPVIFLTARDTLEDKLAGFANGADDYLVKPFEPEELVCRIHAIATRGRQPRVSVQRLGGLEIDHGARTVRRNGRHVKLNELQFKLLQALLLRAPAVASRDVLEREIWEDGAPASDPLRTHIYRLRSALDEPDAKPIIETVYGQGWRLVE